MWERPENLESIDPRTFEAAILTGSFVIAGAEFTFHPRRQPVRLPPDIRTSAVFRIDIKPDSTPDARRISALILGSTPASARGVQIDFDARVSERAFYRELLEQLRRGLAKDRKLSITALSSWCLSDPWIRDLPVDEAVPMLFQMGADAAEVRYRLEHGEDFRLPICRSSLGLSTAEPLPRLPHGRRIYLFSPVRWTPDYLRAAAAAYALS